MFGGIKTPNGMRREGTVVFKKLGIRVDELK